MRRYGEKISMNIYGRTEPLQKKWATCICALFAISDEIFCALFAIFNCALFSHPNQGQLVINGREKMTCTCTCNCVCIEVCGVFIDVTFKCCAKFFLQLYTRWTLCSFCVSVFAWTGMRKFRIDQDFLIEHWHMIYIMPVVIAEIHFRMKLNSILDIN